MAKKISRKELLKGPDEFISFSSTVLDYLKKRQQQFKFVGVSLAVIAIAYFGFNFWTASMNKAAQNDYNAAVQNLQATSMKSAADPGAFQKSGDLFTDVIANYGMSKAARLALPQIAHVKYLAKDYSEAITFYKKYLDRISGDGQYESLTNQALAGCYEAKGDLKEAITILTPLAEASSNSEFKTSARWNLARLYRLDGNPEKSKKILKEIVAQHKDSPFYPMAQSEL